MACKIISDIRNELIIGKYVDTGLKRKKKLLFIDDFIFRI